MQTLKKGKPVSPVVMIFCELEHASYRLCGVRNILSLIYVLQKKVFVTDRRVGRVILKLRGMLLGVDKLLLVLCQVSRKDDLSANRGQEVIEFLGRAFSEVRNST